MKYCNGCKKDRKLDEFGKHSKRKDGKQTQCKECRSDRQKFWYKDNSKLQEVRVRVGRKTSRLKAREFIFTFLSNNFCVDCKETDIVVLDFDHIDPSDKFKGVSRMMHEGYGLSAIKEEIEKCEVRCANCHRKKTAKQFDWQRFKHGSTLASAKLS